MYHTLINKFGWIGYKTRYSGEVNHVIPYQIDQSFIWRALSGYVGKSEDLDQQNSVGTDQKKY